MVFWGVSNWGYVWISTDQALVDRSKIEWVAPDESHRINLVLADVGVEECGDELLRLVLVESLGAQFTLIGRRVQV